MDYDGEEILTLEKVKRNLEEAEKIIAERYKLSGPNIREQIIQLDKDNKLVEDIVVADWEGWYSWYVNWQE